MNEASESMYTVMKKNCLFVLVLCSCHLSMWSQRTLWKQAGWERHTSPQGTLEAIIQEASAQDTITDQQGKSHPVTIPGKNGDTKEWFCQENPYISNP